MIGAQNGIALHLHSGVPVVGIEGEWTDALGGQLAETVSILTGAGHYEIVVNLSEPSCGGLYRSGYLATLEQLAAAIHLKHGHLNIVADRNQVDACIGKPSPSKMRWATSEEQAICRIKGLFMTTGSSKVSARLRSGD